MEGVHLLLKKFIPSLLIVVAVVVALVSHISDTPEMMLVRFDLLCLSGDCFSAHRAVVRLLGPAVHIPCR